jgi:hypothetical protein
MKPVRDVKCLFEERRKRVKQASTSAEIRSGEADMLVHLGTNPSGVPFSAALLPTGGMGHRRTAALLNLVFSGSPSGTVHLGCSYDELKIR